MLDLSFPPTFPLVSLVQKIINAFGRAMRPDITAAIFLSRKTRHAMLVNLKETLEVSEVYPPVWIFPLSREQEPKSSSTVGQLEPDRESQTEDSLVVNRLLGTGSTG